MVIDRSDGAERLCWRDARGLLSVLSAAEVLGQERSDQRVLLSGGHDRAERLMEARHSRSLASALSVPGLHQRGHHQGLLTAVRARHGAQRFADWIDAIRSGVGQRDDKRLARLQNMALQAACNAAQRGIGNDREGAAEAGDATILMYGHMDKQPEMIGWAPDLAPWKPVVAGDKLYGRGGADDGYATYASLAAIMALHDRGVDHLALIRAVAGALRRRGRQQHQSLAVGDQLIGLDHGHGLAGVDMEKIFAPFYTTKPEGMGIGLAICRSIIEFHQGRLWVTPRREGGTEFHFTVPMEEDDGERND